MSQELYVVGNTTLINGQFTFKIFDHYYDTFEAALAKAKSEAEASLNNYQVNHVDYSIDTVTEDYEDADGHAKSDVIGYSICTESGAPIDIMITKKVTPELN